MRLVAETGHPDNVWGFLPVKIIVMGMGGKVGEYV